MSASLALAARTSRCPIGPCMTVALAIVLGACASSPPAPVEHRTRSGAEAVPAAQRPAPTPAQAPVAPKPPAGPRPAAAAAPEPTVAQSAPVRASGIEVRPLAPPVVAAPASSPGVRREPKGTKRPFSDSALAELKAADAASRTDGKADSPGRTESSRADPPLTPAASPPAGAPAQAAASASSSVKPAPLPPPGPAVVKPVPAAQPAAPGVAPPAQASAPSATSAADGATDFAWPTKGKVTQSFGEAKNTGISIAAATGEAVQAAADGKVIFSGQGPRGYGNLIIVKHDADTLSVYGHNRTLLVKEGQSVRKGQRIGEAGENGGDHPRFLFEIRKAGKPVDPLKFLPSR